MKMRVHSVTGGSAYRGNPAWVQRVGALTGIPSLLLQFDVDSDAVLASAGLAVDALDHRENRISYAAFGDLLARCAAATGCAHFGLVAGRMWHLEDMGLVGELIRNSATVGQALRTHAAYHYLNCGGGLAFLTERAAIVDSGYAVYQPGVAGVDQIYACMLAGRFNLLRELCGPDWVPTEIFLPHEQPHDVAIYRNLFRVRPHFNAELGAIRFPSYWLARSIEGADPERRRLAKERVEQVSPPILLQQVHRAIRTLLLSGSSSGDDVAALLAIHRRTLNRRLKDHGTTYREVLDGVRFEMARQLLYYTHVSLDDVAATLGYASVSPFMRTFRRWSGNTPGEWRRWARDHRPGVMAALQSADDGERRMQGRPATPDVAHSPHIDARLDRLAPNSPLS